MSTKLTKVFMRKWNMLISFTLASGSINWIKHINKSFSLSNNLCIYKPSNSSLRHRLLQMYTNMHNNVPENLKNSDVRH